MSTQLVFDVNSPLAAHDAGLQISRGDGSHIDRVMSCFDLLFVREGILPIREEEREFEVTHGQALILWPGRRHRGTANFSPDMRLYWLHFNLNYQGLPNESSHQDVNIVTVPQYSTVERPEVLESLFRRFLDDQATGRLLPYYSSALTKLMLYEVADKRLQGRTDPSAASLASRALTYIRSHLNEKLTTSTIAQEMGYHPDYLSRIFEKTYQRTLTTEIHLSRVGYARYLLLNSSCKMEEIATRCGFTDINYFSESLSATKASRLQSSDICMHKLTSTMSKHWSPTDS